MTHAPSQMPDEIYLECRFTSDGDIHRVTFGDTKYIRADLVETRAASVQCDKERADVPTGLPQTTALDAKRYRRLRVLGVAPGHTEHLKNGNVLRFTNLDDFVDSDLSNYVRGETALTLSDQTETIKALLDIVPSTPLPDGMQRDLIADVKRLIARQDRQADQTIKALVEALVNAENLCKAIVEGYPNPDITHVDYRVQITKWAQDFLQDDAKALALAKKAGA